MYRYHNNDILKVSNKTEEGGLVIVKSISGLNEANLNDAEKAILNNIVFKVTGQFREVTGTDPETGKPTYSDASEKTITLHYSDFTDGRYRFDQALLVAGLPVDDPVAFCDAFDTLMV